MLNEENVSKKVLIYLEFMMYLLVKYKSSCMKIRSIYLNIIWKNLKLVLINVEILCYDCVEIWVDRKKYY